MKKIVALVLCLVLALSLCTVAMAADKYDLYLADNTNLSGGKLKTDAATAVPGTTIAVTAAETYSDGSGVIEVLTFGNDKYTKTTNPTHDDYAVTLKDKTDILYYVTKLAADAPTTYVGSATVFTNFGLTTGQVNRVDTDKKYYAAVKGTDLTAGDVYVYDEATAWPNVNLLVDGKIVQTTKAETSTTREADKVVAASYLATDFKVVDKETVPTEVTDVNSGKKFTAIYEKGDAPAGSKVEEVPNYAKYEFVVTAATSAGSSTTVESAKTFDAGIALYAGMALASVAGSAVVIGKKKEF